MLQCSVDDWIGVVQLLECVSVAVELHLLEYGWVCYSAV